jgi:hypothetical protein
MTDHTRRFVEEQQTHHRFCSACGRHDPPDPRCPDRPSALWAMLTDPEWPEIARRIVARVRDREAMR